MAVISRHRWRISIVSAFTLLALILSLGFAIASRVQMHKVWLISYLALFPGGNTSVVDVFVFFRCSTG